LPEPDTTDEPSTPAHRVRSDVPFYIGLGILGGAYVLLIVACLAADALYTAPADIWRVLVSPEIRYAVKLSLVSSLVTTLLALWVAIPIGYVLSRFRFRGRVLLDSLLDIPIVLPPLVIGVSLLILFQTAPGRMVEGWAEQIGLLLTGRRGNGFTYAVPGVILAQFLVASAFAVRTLRTTFDQIPVRKEQVAMTLGCNRSQAFRLVVLPEARTGILAAATLTWARAIGEFGPVIVFTGSVSFRTEVLPTSVFLRMGVGDLEGAVALSLVMVAIALAVLVVVRLLGHEEFVSGAVR